MNNNLTHKHFTEGSRLPHPGERIIFCSCFTERAIVKQFNETLIGEPGDESRLGCRIRKDR
jgi:hypothetical protein